MVIRNILYPTDFSSCARGAFGLAIELARAYGARLHLLHVVALPGDVSHEPMFDMPAGQETYERLAREIEAVLAPLVREAEAAGVATVTAQPRGPAVGATILAYARQHDVGLIVMGTHGRRGPARMLLGSLTEEVLRYGTCPVLSVRGGNVPRTLPRLLLVPFDFSPLGRRALATAADLARRSPAVLRLLHVLEKPPLGELDGAPAADLEMAQRRQMVDVQLRLEGALASLAPGLPAEVEVRVGRLGDEIARASAEPGVDLVVMAGESSTGARRLLSGGTVETVLRMAQPPVFLVKEEETTAPAAPSAGGGRAEKTTMRVMDVMQWEPRVATPEMSLERVGRIMEEAGCGFLPVVGEGNRVLGVITDRDVCLALAGGGSSPSGVQVRELLRGVVWSCAASDDVGAALRTMSERKVRRLPVLAHDGRLAGILSLDDVLAEARPEGDAGHPSFAQVVTTMQAICRHAVPAAR